MYLLMTMWKGKMVFLSLHPDMNYKLMFHVTRNLSKVRRYESLESAVSYVRDWIDTHKMDWGMSGFQPIHIDAIDVYEVMNM